MKILNSSTKFIVAVGILLCTYNLYLYVYYMNVCVCVLACLRSCVRAFVRSCEWCVYLSIYLLICRETSRKSKRSKNNEYTKSNKQIYSKNNLFKLRLLFLKLKIMSAFPSHLLYFTFCSSSLEIIKCRQEQTTDGR